MNFDIQENTLLSTSHNSTRFALRASGHDVTAKTFPGFGHSLLIMKGNTILGYAEGYLDFIVSWAHGQVQAK